MVFLVGPYAGRHRDAVEAQPEQPGCGFGAGEFGYADHLVDPQDGPPQRHHLRARVQAHGPASATATSAEHVEHCHREPRHEPGDSVRRHGPSSRPRTLGLQSPAAQPDAGDHHTVSTSAIRGLAAAGASSTAERPGNAAEGGPRSHAVDAARDRGHARPEHQEAPPAGVQPHAAATTLVAQAPSLCEPLSARATATGHLLSRARAPSGAAKPQLEEPPHVRLVAEAAGAAYAEDEQGDGATTCCPSQTVAEAEQHSHAAQDGLDYARHACRERQVRRTAQADDATWQRQPAQPQYYSRFVSVFITFARHGWNPRREIVSINLMSIVFAVGSKEAGSITQGTPVHPFAVDKRGPIYADYHRSIRHSPVTTSNVPVQAQNSGVVVSHGQRCVKI